MTELFLSNGQGAKKEFCGYPVVETINLNEQVLQTFKRLHEFRLKAQFTDVTLCVGDEELPCHKVVLAGSSQYFCAMFSSLCKEQQTSRVVLEHVSPWAVRRLLDFAYLGILKLSTDTVQDIFLAASLLDYSLATKACVRFMEKHLEIDNCLGVEALADLHDLVTLKKSARRLAIENFSTLVSNSSEWRSLPLSSVLSYVSSDDLDVPSEQCVWNACMEWVNHDPERRCVHLPSLLSHIRLRHLSLPFLDAQLRENSVLKEHRMARELIWKVLQSTSQEQRTGISTDKTGLRPRPATLKRPTLVVLGGLNTCILNCMQSFSPSKSTWLQCPPMPVDSLAWFSATVVSNILFVVGGIKSGTIMSTVYKYQPNLGSWSQCASLPEARARHGAVGVGGLYIFIFGGITMVQPGDEPHSSCVSPPGLSTGHPQPSFATAATILRYDVRSDSWTLAGQSNLPRMESHVAIVDDWTDENEQTSPRVVDCGCRPSLGGRLPDSEPLEIDVRWRTQSSHIHTDRTLVEVGGFTEAQPRGTDLVSLYRLCPDLTVLPTCDYIKLPELMRYVNCAVHQTTNLVYFFWEETSELSVMNLTGRTLRNLAQLPCTQSDRIRVHAGFTWVGELLYVVGGFSELIGADRRPTTPRDDVYCYNPQTNCWTSVQVTSDTVPRAVFGCVSLNM